MRRAQALFRRVRVGGEPLALLFPEPCAPSIKSAGRGHAACEGRLRCIRPARAGAAASGGGGVEMGGCGHARRRPAEAAEADRHQKQRRWYSPLFLLLVGHLPEIELLRALLQFENRLLESWGQITMTMTITITITITSCKDRFPKREGKGHSPKALQ